MVPRRPRNLAPLDHYPAPPVRIGWTLPNDSVERGIDQAGALSANHSRRVLLNQIEVVPTLPAQQLDVESCSHLSTRTPTRRVVQPLVNSPLDHQEIDRQELERREMDRLSPASRMAQLRLARAAARARVSEAVTDFEACSVPAACKATRPLSPPRLGGHPPAVVSAITCSMSAMSEPAAMAVEEPAPTRAVERGPDVAVTQVKSKVELLRLNRDARADLTSSRMTNACFNDPAAGQSASPMVACKIARPIPIRPKVHPRGHSSGPQRREPHSVQQQMPPSCTRTTSDGNLVDIEFLSLFAECPVECLSGTPGSRLRQRLDAPCFEAASTVLYQSTGSSTTT